LGFVNKPALPSITYFFGGGGNQYIYKKDIKGMLPIHKGQIQKHYALKLSSIMQSPKPKKIQFFAIEPDTPTIQQPQK